MNGFEYNSNAYCKLQNIHPKLDDNGDLETNGSSYKDGSLKLLCNHPDIVTHIPELLVIWGANTDQKIITSYPQCRNYLLKYILKNETQSEYFTNVAKVVISKLDEDSSVRKAAQKIVLNSVGQCDMTIN